MIMRNRDVIAILIVVLLFVAGAVFLTESNHKKHTDPAFPDNSLEFIQMDIETGRIRCAKTLENTGHCEEWIIYKRVKN